MTKRIIAFAIVLLTAGLQYRVFAQYKTEDQAAETQEMLYLQNDIQTKTSKGEHMTDAGKAMLFTGASVALTGAACYIGGAAMYKTDPEAPEMPVYPLFAISGAVAGGVIALIGLPFYIHGKNKMNSYGSSHITFGDDGQEGGAGFFEIGLGIPNLISLDAIGGYNFGRNFFMGAGLGYKEYLTAGLRNGGATASLPIYANFRYSIGNKRVLPYVGASVGYDVANTGVYSGVEFGTRIRKIEGRRGASWWIGARSEFILPDGMIISLKVGRSF